MFCNKCGNPLQDGARFCMHCGAPAPGTENQPAPDGAPAPDRAEFTAPIPALRGVGKPGVCPRCGAELEPDTGKCPYCDAGFPAPHFDEATVTPEQKKEKKPKKEKKEPIPEDDNGEEQTDGRKGSRLSAVLIVLIVLLLAALSVFALSWFGVIKNVPVISELTDRLRGAAEPDATEGSVGQEIEIGETVAPSRAQLPPSTEPAATQGATEATTAVPAEKTPVTISGYLQYEVHETYEDYTVIGLIPDRETAVKPDNRDESVKVRRVVAEGEDLKRYCGKHVTLTGVPTAADRDGETVITFSDSTVELLPADDRLNGLYDGGVPVKIAMKSAGYKLNVRATPDMKGTVLNTVANGASVSILGENGEWILIDYGSKQGWVHAETAGLMSVTEADKPEAETTAAPAADPAKDKPLLKPTRAVAADEVKKDEAYGRAYPADYIYDDDPATCWMANAEKPVWVQLDFAGKETVSGVKLIAGNNWDGKLKNIPALSDPFAAYARPQRFTLTFSDGSTETFTAKDVKETAFGANVFLLKTPVKTTYVRLTVDSVFKGKTEQNMVCIAELAAF